MQTTAKNKISDVTEFTKLFKVNIPIEEDFNYYVRTLTKSREFGHPNHKLDRAIDSFIDLENYVSENGYSNVREYKNKCLDTLKDYILSTNVYGALQSTPLTGMKMATKNAIGQVGEFDILISFDFMSANYSILKSFQVEVDDDELEESWEALCEKFNIHECLIMSKSFRQIVFGNTNPKRLQTFQHEQIMVLVDFLKNVGVKEEEFIFISHDEIIIKVNGSDSINLLIGEHLLTMEKLTKMPIRFTPFLLKKLKKNTFVKTVCSINKETYNFETEYETLHGAPGNKYYMYFKKHILKEPIEDRDLTYLSDGELCKWIDEDAPKQKKHNFPHYERPKNTVSSSQAIQDYPYIWKNLITVLPNLTSEETRRIIEVFANTCKHCHEADSDCQCWNDD